MVQRKASYKLGSQSESKRNHLKLERQLSSHQQQDTRSRGGGDLKKKMKKVRSIKVSSLENLEVEESMMKKPKRPAPVKASAPNYMKPTSSWDARKEQLQVPVHSHTTTDKKPSLRNLKILNSSKPPSSSPSGSGLKTSKALSRTSSLKPVRPLMKKNSKIGIVNRATCSSTLKDSKFPKALDLNPEGTEADGTSVFKVCPYTYCSLNGHRHEPLPPLKCFMSGRRKLLKTQKSMKLKGLSPLKGKYLWKGEKEIDTGQIGVEIAPLMEEETNDFFVEIYTSKPQEHTVEFANCDEKSNLMEDPTEKPEVLSELAVVGNSGECVKCEVEEDEQMNESRSDISFDDDIDQSSELSDEGMDVMMGFLEYVECEQQSEESQEEKISGLVPEDYGEWCYECCLVDVLSKNGEAMEESENKVSAIEPTDMDWEGEAGQFPDTSSEYSESSDDGFGCITSCDELSIRPASTLIAHDVAETDAELPQKVAEVAEHGDTLAFDDGNSVGNDAETEDGEEVPRLDVSDVNSKPQEPESLLEKDQSDASEVEGNGVLNSYNVNIFESSLQGSEEVISEEPEDSETGHAPETDDSNCSILEPDDMEAQQNFENESIEEEKNENVVVDDTSLLFKVQLSDSYQGFREKDQVVTKGNPVQTECNTEVGQFGQVVEDESTPSEILNCPDDQSDESNSENWGRSEKEQRDEISKPKTRMNIRRKRTTMKHEQMKEFNPRAPRFLPVEPEPDAEKVDLRHQLMDERKNAEEWMIDYALQRAVNNLAPARKRKVALLVEAFETVIPPMYEKPLRQSTSGFAHTRPIQACS